MATFTININGGKVLETFEASSFEEFMDALSDKWTFGSEDGLRQFFSDRFQVKAPISDNLLVCRPRDAA